MKSLKNTILLFCLIGILIACEPPAKDETVRISAEIPETIQMGIPDTLFFTITSDVSLENIYVEEDDINYITLNSETFGKFTRYYQLNLIYNPKFPGIKNMEMKASDGTYTATYAFTLSVIE